MHRHTTKWISLTVALLVVAMGISQSHAQTVNWKLFSGGIKMALESDNQGVKESAICLILKYGKKLDLQDSLDDLVKFYRNQQAEQTQKLALLAIYKLDQQMAFKLLAERLESDQQDALKIISIMHPK